jgi:NADH-ubiquinone oxidoreductase chain 3
MQGSTIFFIIFIPFLAFVLLGLSVLLGPHNPYSQKGQMFECGFSSFRGQNRTEFSISFFIFGLIFLILDLEILLIYPYAISSYNNSYYGLFFVFLFILILTVGFVFEFGKGALAIHSRQTGYLESSNIKIDRERNSKNLYKSRSSSSVSPRKGFKHQVSIVKRFFSSQSTPNNETVVPVRVYNNLDLDKLVILSENKGKSGVYRLTNLVNGKVYIGSSINLSKRFTNYYSYAYISEYKRNMTIYKAILKSPPARSAGGAPRPWGGGRGI